jgi:hypothetical protein
VEAKQTITTELSSQQATSSIEAEKAIQVATQLLRSRCNDQTSFYRGIKLRDGEAILKFRVKESRICPYGEEHTRNSFGIVCDGICMEYRCLSSGCKERPRVLLGLHHWLSHLISKSRFDLRPIQEAERIILRAKSTMDKVQYQQICQELTQIAIKTMNHYFCVLDGSSKVLFIESIFVERGTTWVPNDSILRTRAEFLERSESFNLDSHKIGNLGKVWCKSSARKTLNKVVFETNSRLVSPDKYNMFYGFPFAYDADQPVDMIQIDLLLKHINEVLADNDPAVAEYILNWLAHLVQKPYKKIGTALVFRSDQGAGKSIVTDFVGKRVIGSRYYLYCNDMEKVTGKFNGIAANLLLV